MLIENFFFTFLNIFIFHISFLFSFHVTFFFIDLCYVYWVNSNSLNCLLDRPRFGKMFFQDPATSIFEKMVLLHHEILFYMFLLFILVLWFIVRINILCGSVTINRKNSFFSSGKKIKFDFLNFFLIDPNGINEKIWSLNFIFFSFITVFTVLKIFYFLYTYLSTKYFYFLVVMGVFFISCFQICILSNASLIFDFKNSLKIYSFYNYVYFMGFNIFFYIFSITYFYIFELGKLLKNRVFKILLVNFRNLNTIFKFLFLFHLIFFYIPNLVYIRRIPGICISVFYFLVNLLLRNL